VHAIVIVWPNHRGKRVCVKQDNATPHILPTDPHWVEVTGF
jgi:hypothetical protein